MKSPPLRSSIKVSTRCLVLLAPPVGESNPKRVHHFSPIEEHPGHQIICPGITRKQAEKRGSTSGGAHICSQGKV